MEYILFDKHPGDLLKIVNLKTRHAVIIIDQLILRVVRIQFTSQLQFKVYIEMPKSQIDTQILVKTLGILHERKIILEYKVS